MDKDRLWLDFYSVKRISSLILIGNADYGLNRIQRLGQVVRIFNADGNPAQSIRRACLGTYRKSRPSG